MEGRINDAEDCVRKALCLIPLLISDAFYTKVFTGRWQAIASKLQLLNQTITAIIKEPYWSENSLLKELLSNVVSTLQVARELAKCCRVLSCSWKLMKQRDMDVLVDKLNFHHRDLQLLIKSGLLRESNDVNVVSRPGLGARRDVVVLFLRGLFARIQIGNTQFKEQALFLLVQILLEDDKNIIIVVAEEKLDIGFLVHLLYSHIVTLRECSVVAVSILVQSDACKACLVREGVIEPLIRILESGRCVAKEKAAEALLGLTIHDSDMASLNVGLNVTLGICPNCNSGKDIDRENACAISAHGGLSALVEICKSGSLKGQAIASAVLRNLAFVEELRGPMAEEGAIPVLINLVNCGTTLTQESSAQCLYLLASNHENLRQRICMEVGVESLVLFLERAPSPEAQEIILKTIHSLSASICSISLLMSSGFVKDLTVLLGSGRVEIQELAALIICNLSRTEETKRALGEAGCIGLLAKILKGEPSFSQAIAARALSSLLAEDCNRKEFVKNDENVCRLVQLLDPQNDTVANIFLISALLALSHSSSGRKKMACAGAYQHLEKLADLEVGGAKKVLHKMTTKSKLRRILSSKW